MFELEVCDNLLEMMYAQAIPTLFDCMNGGMVIYEDDLTSYE